MNEKLHSSQITICLFMIQTGITIFSLPRIVAETFGTNGWIGLLFVSALVCINLYLIVLVYWKGGGESVFEILEQKIPKIVLSPLYIVMILIGIVIGIMVAKNYTLLIKLMLFKEINLNYLMFLLLIIVVVFLRKGIYNMAKTTVVFFFFIIFQNFIFPFTLKDFSFTRMTTFFFQGDLNLWRGGIEVYSAFIGFVIILFFIPYVQKDTNYGRAVFIGHFLTTAIYLYICIISFGFFSFEHLKNVLYPTLKLLKYIQTPVIERIENVAFSVYLFSIITTSAFHFWLAIEFLKRFFKKTNEKWLVYCVIAIAFVFSTFFGEKREIDIVMSIAMYPYIALSFFIPLLVLGAIWLNKKSKKKEMNANG